MPKEKNKKNYSSFKAIQERNTNFWKGGFRVNGDTARIPGTGQITAIVSNHSCPSISAGGWPRIRFSSILTSPLWSRMATLFSFLPSPKEILRCIKVSCPKWTQIKLKRFGVIGARRCEGGGRDLMRKLVPITGRGHHCPPSFAAFQGVEQCLGCNIYFHLDKSSTLKTDCLR